MIRIQPDFDRSEGNGGEGVFRITSIVYEDENGQELDLTANIDQGKHFSSARQVILELGLDPDQENFEFV